MPTKNIFSLLTLLVAVVATVGAFYSVYNAREIARQQTTLEFAAEHRKEMKPYKEIQLASEFQDGTPTSSKLDEAKFLLARIERYDLLIVGLRHKVYDEEIIFDILAQEIVEFYGLYEERGAEQADLEEGVAKGVSDLKKLADKAKAHLAKNKEV